MVPFFDLRPRAATSGEGLSVVHQTVVNLVRQNIDIVPDAHLHQRFQLFPAVDHAGGDGGIIDHEQLWFLSVMAFSQLFRGVILKFLASLVRMTTGGR
jgi:hypothetical protein